MFTDVVPTNLGHITPPDDNWLQGWDKAEQTVDSSQFMARGERSTSDDLGSSHPTGFSGRADKKDKYREKNRVAAAKCRAKKKEHVDDLEENHRTQSMLNALLKQTEQNLRDELSFWRTQALSHAYCECSSIQEYNLKKARALAADKNFGDQNELRRDSLDESPMMKVENMPFCQHTQVDYDNMAL